MAIVNLSDEPSHIRTLAEFHHAEWSKFNPDCSLQLREKKMRHYLTSDLVPSTYVYKQKDKLAGSVSIVKHDMSTRLDLSPWVTSVFVLPEFRRQGIAKKLIDHILFRVKKDGIKKIYLFTDDKSDYYLKNGWNYFSDELYQEIDVKIMSFDV